LITTNQKRLILFYFAILISTLIWNINQNVFGNPFLPCFILSIATFLLIITPFEIYWSFRDIWYDRWKKIRQNDIDTQKIRIEVDRSKRGKSKNISVILLNNKNDDLDSEKNTVVIICHGFSDSKESLEFFYLPLINQGYSVLAYDARGTGESKKVGRRNQFLERIDDFKKIIDWVRDNEKLKDKQIYCVGFSIGAITVLCGGYSNPDIKKIIVSSSISNYKSNLRQFNPFLLLSYVLKGVKIFPSEIENYHLSPSLIITDIQKNVPEKEWNEYSKRIFLIHAKNDKVIKFENFKELTNILSSPEQNLMTFRKGGHSLKKNELMVISTALKFFNSD